MPNKNILIYGWFYYDIPNCFLKVVLYIKIWVFHLYPVGSKYSYDFNNACYYESESVASVLQYCKAKKKLGVIVLVEYKMKWLKKHHNFDKGTPIKLDSGKKF